jgi:hypothetical protein
MATTTPNYGWDVPTSTDYVADGAVAIETLGDDIDASLFSITSGKNVGNVLISSQTVTTSSLVTFDNVFTSGFENYLIEFNGRSSGPTAQMRSKFRTGGVANSNSNYAFVVTQATSSNTGPTNRAWGTGSSDIELIDMDSTTGSNQSILLNVFSPQATQYTRWTFFASNVGSGSAVIGYQISGGAFTNTTSFDGIQFSLVSGTITGSFRIYGLRNS